MSRPLALACVLALLTATPAASAPLYRLVDLGFAPGATASTAARFGVGGAVLGRSEVPATFGGHATRWDVSAEGVVLQVTDLGGLPGFDWSSAYGMNASGWIAGHSNTADPQPRAVLWRNGQVVDIESGADGNANIYAFDVNDAGVVCGFLTKSGGGGNWDAAIWIERPNQPGRFDRTILPLHPSGDPLTAWTEAQSITETGRVFGRTGLNPGDRATIWEADAAHTPVLLEPLANSDQSMPGTMNELGDAVGYTMYPFGLDRPTRWSRDAAHVPAELPIWPGHNAGVATLVDPSGATVFGFSRLIDTSVFPWPTLEERVVMWNADGLWDLNARLDASGAGWTVFGTSDVNADGWIAATAATGGIAHAVLLIPVVDPVAVESAKTGSLALASPSPNPARGAVRLGFTLERAGEARLAIVDAQGRRVAEPARGAFDAGAHDFTWDGRDASGRSAAPGIYFVTLEAGGARAYARLVRVR